MAEHFVPTRGALLKRNAASDFKIVTYESYKAKPKTKIGSGIVSVGESEDGAKEGGDTRKGIDIQRARREIIKFGISGFSHERQQEAKVALAISLGARAPKGEYKNYKELQARKKRQQALDKKYQAMQQVGKNALGVSTARKKFVFNKALNPDIKKHKRKEDLLQIYGKATIDTTPSKPKTNMHKRNTHKKKR